MPASPSSWLPTDNGTSVAVGTAVTVSVGVRVAVRVGVWVAAEVGVLVTVLGALVAVGDGVPPGVAVDGAPPPMPGAAMTVASTVGVVIAVGSSETVATGVNVTAGVSTAVAVASTVGVVLAVRPGVAVDPLVAVAVGVGEAVAVVVPVAVAVAVAVGVCVAIAANTMSRLPVAEPLAAFSVAVVTDVSTRVIRAPSVPSVEVVPEADSSVTPAGAENVTCARGNARPY
jgi:hypothetical protein